MLDDHELDAVLSCCLFSAFFRVALIYKSHFDVLARHLLRLTGESFDLRRSCSLAGVTTTASGSPSVSTAA